MKKIQSDFLSQRVRCSGNLYLPENSERPPVIIMCHGIGTEKTFGLLPYAERFTSLGFAVFQFDYRNFGESEGEPRNLINPNRHIKDIISAIRHIQNLNNLNTKKIALWGSSFGGGHVLVAASKVPEISCVISQVPFVDGIATTFNFSFKYILTAMFHGILDIIKTLTFLKPHTVKIVGKPHEFALMNTEESDPGYRALIPKNSKWKNETPARINLTISLYRPTLVVNKISCPVLIIYAKNDSLIPYSAIEKAANKIKNVEKILMDTGHFDLYFGELFEKSTKIESEFYAKHLK